MPDALAYTELAADLSPGLGSTVQSHWKDQKTRRILVALAVTTALVLLGVRIFVLPTVSASLDDAWLLPATETLDELIATLVSAVVVGLLVLWLLGPLERERKAVQVVRARQINDLAPRAASSSEYWWYRGHTGTFVRSVVIPEMERSARRTKTPRHVKLLILDPEDDAALDRFIAFRQTVVSPRAKRLDKTALREKICGVIVAAHIWNSGASLVRIDLFLTSDFSMFRIDLHDSGAFITTEDPREPALQIFRRSALWRAWKMELDLQVQRARRVPSVDIRFEDRDPQPAAVKSLLESIGIAVTSEERFLRQVIAHSRVPRNPYSVWKRT